MPSKTNTVDDYPSLLWITIPTILLFSGYFARKWYLSYRLKKHGIGKGAPGFQTGVRRLRITPELAARMQRGEDVTPEEVAAAAAEMEAREAGRNPTSPQTTTKTKKASPPPVVAKEPANEWLPETITTPQKRGKAKRK